MHSILAVALLLSQALSPEDIQGLLEGRGMGLVTPIIFLIMKQRDLRHGRLKPSGLRGEEQIEGELS